MQKKIKNQVNQEIEWFNLPYLKQNTVQSTPDFTSINAFKSMIHNNPNNVDIPGVGINPTEHVYVVINNSLVITFIGF